MKNEYGSRKDKTRKLLFDLFSKNLMVVKKHPRIKIEPDEDDVYFCPICMRGFSREVLSISKDSEDYLTLEDVPPEKLGGKVRTLTCKKCNNTGGSQLEKHISNKLLFEDELQGKFNIPINGKFYPTNDTELAASFKFVGSTGIYAEIHTRRSNLKSRNQFMTMINSREKIDDFSISLYGNYKQSHADIALLRIAYLLAFSTFGYGFLMNFNLQIIRDQLQSPDKKILEHLGILTIDLPDKMLGINLLTEPKEMRSFLVVFDLKTPNTATRYSVLLPGPTEPGIKIYKWLTLSDNKRNIEINVLNIPDDDYLKNENLAFAADEFWRRVQ